MTISATLNGIPLIKNTSISWTLSSGTAPHRETFHMSRSEANALFSRTGSSTKDPKRVVQSGEGTVSLVIDAPGSQRLEVNGLFVMSTGPTDHPDILAVEVADRRVWLDRNVIARSYNVRRRTGDRRRLESEGNLIEINPVVDDVGFQPWTLNDSNIAWTAIEVLKDVMGELFGTEFFIPNGFDKNMPIENFELRDPGATALSRTLSMLSGAELYIDLDGTAVIYDRRSGRDKEIIKEKGPAIRGSLLPEITDLSVGRPESLEVSFVREIETRIDVRLPQSSVVEDQREADNVLPVPDPQLTLASGRSVSQGTWITFNEAFAAWNLPINKRPLQKDDFDDETVRKFWFHRGFLNARNLDPIIGPDLILNLRWAAVFAHYRQSYRIDRKFLDRIRSIRAERAGILDTETGQRAPTTVYADWSVLYSMRGRVANGGSATVSFQSYEGFPSDDKLENGRVSPAIISVVDEDQGILRLSWQLDPTGEVMTLAPGKVEGPDGQKAPTQDPREGMKDPRLVLFPYARLSSTFKAAFVLTMIPSSPNNDNRFHKITVDDRDADKALGIKAGKGKGPVMEIHVPASLETARFAWLDSEADSIDGAFGRLSVAPSDRTLVNGERLQAVAEATAATIYSQFVDRAEGTLLIALDPDFKPEGNISAIVHNASPNGDLTTRAIFPPEFITPDLAAVIPESFRKEILGLTKERGAPS